MFTKKEISFLEESNAIEGVYDAESLNQALIAWEFLKEQTRLSPGIVLEVHKILMKDKLAPEELGHFRRVGVSIGGRLGMPWKVVSEMTFNWCEVANEKSDWDSIKQDHINFENIHPFVDGNGRTGRMLMNWQRLQSGLDIVVIKGDDRGRSAYYKWFL